MEFVPRRWWSGPFDVEHLAWTAVARVRDAAQEVAITRGLDVTVDTTPALVAASFASFENLRVDGRAPEAWAELSGLVAARDGWVRLHGNYPHHAAAIRSALSVSDRAQLDRTARRLGAEELEEAVCAAGGIAVAVRSRADWARHPHGLATASAPWSEGHDRGDRPVLSRTATPRELLRGIRVLDLTRVIAGPTCSQLLACLGADVLRVDPPHRPEILDQYLSTGMGKRSVEINLRREADRVRALASSADVILSGYRPGALDRFGLGDEALEQLAPQAVIVTLSAWGEAGPWCSRAGFDSIVQAATGIAAACGSPDRPGALPVQALDHSSGHLMAAHVLEALARARAHTVRVSLLGAARTLLAATPPPPREPAALDVPRVRVPSAEGVLDAVPPPLRIDGATLERPVGRYGAARAEWSDRSG
ncbi:CoA transferase [Brachybacterium sp. GCM10030267]|uniref:CoA transferase n=1 Tax=Brachybacterium sp. GCM10030267 TaxID=3273381 RepID=UPI0036087887